jgi:hypothetical protein
MLKTNYLAVRLIKGTPALPFDGWFLPSKDELNAMYTELKAYGLGGFQNFTYWSSSEKSLTSNAAWKTYFLEGSYEWITKNNLCSVRACRFFTSTMAYSLRDIGPAGGYIFWKSGNDYLEAAPSDQSTSQAWSNITNVAIGTTGTAIGTGQVNTTAIIGQAGHTTSAAKLCNDLIIYH